MIKLVSIIIVNWNTRELLRQCLHSIYRETEGIEFEVILIDNASSDNSAEMVQHEFPQVALIHNAQNRGFAAANNQGLAIAKGDYVLLLNPDTLVVDGAIQKSTEFAEQNPKAAVVGVRNDDGDGQLTRNCFMFPSVTNLVISTLGLHRAFPQSQFFGRERLTWWSYLDNRQVDAVAGCYMLVRRDALENVGGLDESYFMYGEEVDWCWRFKQAGWQIWYYSGAKIIHYGGMSAAQNPVEMQIHGQRSYLRFLDKRYGRLAQFVVHALLAVSGALRVVYWSGRWLFARGDLRKVSGKKLRQAITATSGR